MKKANKRCALLLLCIASAWSPLASGQEQVHDAAATLAEDQNSKLAGLSGFQWVS